MKSTTVNMIRLVLIIYDYNYDYNIILYYNKYYITLYLLYYVIIITFLSIYIYISISRHINLIFNKLDQIEARIGKFADDSTEYGLK